MIRLPIWCAFGILAVLLLSAAASPDLRAPDASAAPHFLGTVALQVAKTPYDEKWNHAGLAGRGRTPMLDKHRAGPLALLDLANVQADINQRVSYRADTSRLDSGDAWSTSANTLARGSGDCEDYAIAKGQSLLALGFRPQDLYLVIGNQLALRSAHAILAVRVDSVFWILDNLSKQVVRADQFRNFLPVVTLSANSKWVHGHKKGSFQRIANARARARALNASTDRLSAIKLAQSTNLKADLFSSTVGAARAVTVMQTQYRQDNELKKGSLAPSSLQRRSTVSAFGIGAALYRRRRDTLP